MEKTLSDFRLAQLRNAPSLATLDEVSKMAVELAGLRGELAYGPVMPLEPSDGAIAKISPYSHRYAGHWRDWYEVIRSALMRAGREAKAVGGK